MTFLNPLVLFGLAAAAIPIILHLLNLRKLRTIEFSTLTFLKELQQTKIRRLKLRQILLLITRTLLIVAVVLAFARPAIRGTIWGNIGSHAYSTVVFIFDDSFSMIGSDEHGELFKQSKDAAEKLIDLLKEGDEAFLIKLSDVPQGTIDPAIHDFDALRTIIKESQISYLHRSLDDALRLSAKLLQRSTNANKEIYLISDMQRSAFVSQISQSEKNTSSFFHEQVNIFYIPIGTKEIANAAIDSINVTTTILEIDKSVTVYASLRNYSNTLLNNYLVNTYLDGIKTSQKNISIDPWGSAATELSILPKRTGFLKGYIETENDAIEIDNRRYFTLYIPPQIKITIASESEPDDKFIRIALQSKERENKQSLFDIQRIPAQKLSLLNFKNADVLVCSNIKSFSDNDVEKIKKFVKDGGGLILFPGNDILRENYNTTILPALDITPIENIEGTTDREINLSFQKVDLDHPLFTTVFEKEVSAIKQDKITVESPLIIKTIKRRISKHERTIISMSDGSPFLSEYNLGKGRILLFSIAPTLTWSDIPLKGLFAPLLYRSALYVSPNEKNPVSFIAGNEQIIPVKRMTLQAPDRRFKLIAPSGVEELIEPTTTVYQDNTTNSFFITSNMLSTPGFYEIRHADSPISIFCVNTDKIESDTRKMNPDEIESHMKNLGVNSSMLHFSKLGETLRTEILHSRFGVELWKFCLGFALFMAILEMVIARDSKKAFKQIN